MQSRFESERDEALHRELRRLPDRTAPDTLVPRVLAALEARARLRWWQQPFWHWTVPVQTALIGLLVANAAIFMWVGWAGARIALGDPTPALLLKVWATASVLWETVSTLLDALFLVLRVGLQPWMIGALVVSFMMYLACVGMGTVCLRMAYKRS